ncbi:MAG: cyclic nucleotide-binding domain-containing protein, partial [Nitriliruptoraceae bacterium]
MTSDGTAATDGLTGRLRTIPPFDGLPLEVVAEVAAASRLRDVVDGDHLVETGDVAEQLYVVLAGRFAVLAAPDDASEGALSELGPGSIVGEIAVLTGGRRSATLRAVGDAEVAAIDGERFVSLLDDQPELGAILARTASDRLLATRLRRHLTALFPAVDIASLAETVDRTDIVTLAPGEVLFDEGDPADAAYVLIAGRVRVLRHDADGGFSQPIAEVGAGELIGERALLHGQQRAATIVAARRTQLARLPRVAFEELALTDPRTVLAVTR